MRLTRKEKHTAIGHAQKVTALLLLDRALTKQEEIKLDEHMARLSKMIDRYEWTKEPK